MTPPGRHFCAALVQMRSGRDTGRNVADASDLIRAAARAGAEYVQTPETTAFMELDGERLAALVRTEEETPALACFCALAQELGLWLHIGSIPVRHPSGRFANRSFLISPKGLIAARYDKIHMFDVELPGGEFYRESRNYEPGRQAVLARLPWGLLGMTVCYDLRFPTLYRALARAGAAFLAVPAAFTRLTGEAHWHTLLKARAIESQCFVLAAAQGGRHEHGRETFGHSLIISPWGEILAEAGTEPGFITASISLDVLDSVRSRMPCLTHDRPFEIAAAAPAASAPALAAS